MKANNFFCNMVAISIALVFAALVLMVVTHYVRDHLPAVLALSAALGLFGLVLIILTIKLQDRGWHRLWLLLMGCAAAGIPLCIVLHNAVYALMIKTYGKNVWGPGGDEPVFFVLAVLVLPVMLVIAAIGSAVTQWPGTRRPAQRRSSRR